MIGVALVGAGGFGRRLAVAAQAVPALRLVAVHDADPAAAAGAARELSVDPVDDLDVLLGRPDLDAVMIATPHGAHVPVGLAAIGAGKHVFVEKPLSITVAEGRRLVDAARESGRTLLVGHVTRLLPVVRAALERLDRGDLGRPLAVAMTRHQYLPRLGWRARRADYGMLLHSPAVHNLDLMNRVLGQASRVAAIAAPPIQKTLEYPDTLALLIAYEAGGVGTLSASVSDPLLAPEGTNSVRILAEGGALAADIVTGRLDVQIVGRAPETRTLLAGRGDIDAALLDELANFGAAIRGEAPPFVEPWEALAAVELCEAADQSVATGRPVTLPLSPVAGLAR